MNGDGAAEVARALDAHPHHLVGVEQSVELDETLLGVGLLAYAGLRWGELVALTTRRVDLKAGGLARKRGIGTERRWWVLVRAVFGVQR